MTKTVHLGFEVGSGKAVEIPVAHMCVTGQSQQAGKTTTLEALITRSKLSAVTFITKRGESSFGQARRIRPYFREQADWQFVASILEASRGEKLKFERAWIIRASKGARTLADVHRNVKHAMEKAKGLSADVYLTLDAYLEAVVPTIARVQWAAGLELRTGVNAVDLTDIPGEMQHLVIKSTLDWVLDREQATVVVIPEAWKFIPQGRGTPVKLAAAAFIRQGAALKNYLWLDSQDLGGIEKEILRSVPLWILGVQRETNEIKRTLDNIPAGTAKPSKADIATLELGQFYACWGKHAIKTYVQPAWLDEPTAVAIARGEKSTEPLTRVVERIHQKHQEDFVTTDEAARLTRENEQLKAENADLRRRLDALERGQHDVSKTDRAAHRGRDSQGRAGAGDRDGAATPHAGDAGHLRGCGGDGTSGERAAATGGRSFSPKETFDNERLYQAIKARLIEEAPAVLKLVYSQPSVHVSITRPTLTFEEYSLKWRLVRLLADGFFADERKSPSQIRAALKRTGPDANTANIGRAMDDLVKVGVFTDEGSGYLAVPGIEVERELVGA